MAISVKKVMQLYRRKKRLYIASLYSLEEQMNRIQKISLGDDQSKTVNLEEEISLLKLFCRMYHD